MGDEYLPNLLTVILIPKGHTYLEGYDPVDEAKFIAENLDVETAFNILSFFENVCVKSVQHTQRYLKAAEKLMTMKTKMARTLSKKNQ